MKDLLQLQYELVRASRAVLMTYVATLSQQDFISSSPVFGRGSVRNMLVHICDTYHYWIAARVLQTNPVFPACDTYRDLESCRVYFAQTDDMMALFFAHFQNNYLEPLSVSRSRGTEEIRPLTLFTHVTTHEFHHKGQILSLSRDLGYTPVDTDIIR